MLKNLTSAYTQQEISNNSVCAMVLKRTVEYNAEEKLSKNFG